MAVIPSRAEGFRLEGEGFGSGVREGVQRHAKTVMRSSSIQYIYKNVIFVHGFSRGDSSSPVAMLRAPGIAQKSEALAPRTRPQKCK